MNIKIPLLFTIIAARTVIGLLFSSFAGFVSWVMFFQGSGIDQDIYYIEQSLVVGAPIGMVASLIWWNAESSKFVMLIQLGSVVLISISSAFIAVNVAEIETSTTLYGPSFRVPVVSIGEVFKNMLMGGVVGGNVMAGLFFCYRSVIHNEV